MIFACSIGSAGKTEESYSIIFPLILSPGKKLNLENTCSFQMADGLHYSLEKQHYLYTLKVESFPSEDAAKGYLKNLKASLRWVSLKNKLGLRFPSEVNTPKYAKEPITVSEKSNIYEIVKNNGWTVIDGNYDVDKLTIIPEHKNLMRWEPGHATITLGLSPQNIFSDIDESISFRALKDIQSEKKLCLAIELYSAYQFEVSNTAKFVKLVTVLESLLPDIDIPDEVKPVLETAKKVLKDERRAKKSRNESTELLDHLMSRLGGLKRQSIGSSMMSYISNCIDEFAELGEKASITSKIQEIYNTRSSLLHTGEFDEKMLIEGIELLSVLVPKLLERLYLKCAN
jgi:hypothetical protein